MSSWTNASYVRLIDAYVATCLAIGRRRSPSVAVGRRRSPSVAVGRRRSPSVAVGRRRSPSVAVGRRRSPSVAVGRHRSPSVTTHVIMMVQLLTSDVTISGDLALLVDTSHPMIRPELERALEQARKILQSRGRFCIQARIVGGNHVGCYIYELKFGFNKI